MSKVSNSSQTNRLLQRVRNQDQQALAELFARYRERLRQMVRLRLDGRLRMRFNSSLVLQEVYRDACRRIGEYLADPALPVFLWLRVLTGQYVQALHRQFLGQQFWNAGPELSLYRGALPEANAASLAGQLLGQRGSGQAAMPANLQIRLQDALNSMDPLDREFLALCHFEELSNDEAALVLGIDKVAASHHYVRALERLSEILKGIPGFFDEAQKESH